MKKKMSGQITLEAAIIVPMVMLTVLAIVHLSLYIHDVVVIKSYTYSAAITYKEKNLSEFEQGIKNTLNKAPIYMAKWRIDCSKKTGGYQVTIKISGKSGIRFINRVIGLNTEKQSVGVEKMISREIMYAGRAICDEVGKGKEQ